MYFSLFSHFLGQPNGAIEKSMHIMFVYSPLAMQLLSLRACVRTQQLDFLSFT